MLSLAGTYGLGTRWRTKFADLNGDRRADFLWMKEDGSTDLWNNGVPAAGGDLGEPLWYEKGQVAPGIGPLRGLPSKSCLQTWMGTERKIISMSIRLRARRMSGSTLALPEWRAR